MWICPLKNYVHLYVSASEGLVQESISTPPLGGLGVAWPISGRVGGAKWVPAPRIWVLVLAHIPIKGRTWAVVHEHEALTLIHHAPARQKSAV